MGISIGCTGKSSKLPEQKEKGRQTVKHRGEKSQSSGIRRATHTYAGAEGLQVTAQGV